MTANAQEIFSQVSFAVLRPVLKGDEHLSITDGLMYDWSNSQIHLDYCSFHLKSNWCKVYRSYTVFLWFPLCSFSKD